MTSSLGIPFSTSAVDGVTLFHIVPSISVNKITQSFTKDPDSQIAPVTRLTYRPAMKSYPRSRTSIPQLSNNMFIKCFVHMLKHL